MDNDRLVDAMDERIAALREELNVDTGGADGTGTTA
jgi:hypothetical protein